MSTPAFRAAGLAALRKWHFRWWRNLGPRSGRSHGRRFSATVLKVDRIGDFVLALSAIRMITRRFGEEACCLVIAPAMMEIARAEFPRASLVAVQPFLRHKRAWFSWWRVRRSLAELSCDRLICLRHQRWDYDELMLTWIRSGSVHRLDDPSAIPWAINRRTAETPAVSWTEPVGGEGLCRELALHRHLVAQALNTEVLPAEIVPRFEGVQVHAAADHGVIAPFSSATIKDIPEELLRKLIRVETIRSTDRVVLLGASDQRDRLERLAGRLLAGTDTRIEVVTPPTLTESVSLIGSARWIVSADTAAAHIATAWDRPVVVLLGGGHYGQFGPWSRSSRQRWLSRPLPCFNCGWVCPYSEPHCLTGITVADVAASLTEVVSA